MGGRREGERGREGVGMKKSGKKGSERRREREGGEFESERKMGEGRGKKRAGNGRESIKMQDGEMDAGEKRKRKRKE